MIKLIHTGTSLNGDILGTEGKGGRTFVIGHTPLSSDEMKKRVDARVGEPFLFLPNRPVDHTIVGELKDGSKVTARAAQTVYNDWILLNEIHGSGTYEACVRPLELEVLTLARILYQRIEI